MSDHKLLIVDDDTDVLSYFKEVFRDRHDPEIYSAQNTKDGFSLLKKEDMDIIISDLMMPDLPGTEFLKQVRRYYPDTIRMLLTGYSDIKATIEAINEGEIYRYLTKPWNDQELLVTIDQALAFLDLKRINKDMALRIRKQNKELKESRDSFYSILNSIGEGVITADFDGMVTFINPVAEAYTGFKSRDAGGSPLSEVFYILNGKKHIPLENPVSKIKDEGFCVKNYKNCLLVNKKGVEIFVNFNISPIMDEDSNMTGKGIVLVFHEVNNE